jgi:hypothetical protein
VVLYAAGNTHARIARILGCGKRTVQVALKRRGVKAKAHDFYSAYPVGSRVIRGAYAWVKRPTHRNARSGWVREHLWVWDMAHPNNPWCKGDVIHHKNFNGLDNRSKNLEKLSRAEHAQKSHPRKKFYKGNQAIGSLGERIALTVLHGLRLLEVDGPYDGLWRRHGVEIKTRRKMCAHGCVGWNFSRLTSARLHLLLGLGDGLRLEHAWLVPKSIVNGRACLWISESNRYGRVHKKYDACLVPLAGLT